MITTKEPGSNVCLPLAPYCCKLAELEGWWSTLPLVPPSVPWCWFEDIGTIAAPMTFGWLVAEPFAWLTCNQPNEHCWDTEFDWAPDFQQEVLSLPSSLTSPLVCWLASSSLLSSFSSFSQWCHRRAHSWNYKRSRTNLCTLLVWETLRPKLSIFKFAVWFLSPLFPLSSWLLSCVSLPLWERLQLLSVIGAVSWLHKSCYCLVCWYLLLTLNWASRRFPSLNGQKEQHWPMNP